jgi:16S rRNA A1518/A1519 N6-dimethyltransferase RsmA/KsgA/DIM1 with predicted DNA glycosylase/AP lyase activity
VRSAVLRLIPRPQRPVGGAYDSYLVAVHRVFRWPRKTLRAILRRLGVADPDEVLGKAGARGEARPEDLDPATLARLRDCAPEAFLAEHCGWGRDRGEEGPSP